MMRSLAAIFPGFLPPLAVINATIPCHQKGVNRGWRAAGTGRRAGEREARSVETIPGEGVIPLSVFVNFVSCVSQHYPPYRVSTHSARTSAGRVAFRTLARGECWHRDGSGILEESLVWMARFQRGVACSGSLAGLGV